MSEERSPYTTPTASIDGVLVERVVDVENAIIVQGQLSFNEVIRVVAITSWKAQLILLFALVLIFTLLVQSALGILVGVGVLSLINLLRFNSLRKMYKKGERIFGLQEFRFGEAGIENRTQYTLGYFAWPGVHKVVHRPQFTLLYLGSKAYCIVAHSWFSETQLADFKGLLRSRNHI